MTSQIESKDLGKVLVVGGCGFLGHHIVAQLLESHSAEVAVLDLRVERNRYPSVSYHAGDITSADDVRSVLEAVRPQVIIHTASPLMATLVDNTALFETVNVGGTRNLLECAGQVGCVKAFVYTSSSSVVHDGVSDLVGADESLPVLRRPVQPELYSETKAIAEGMVLAANRQHGSMLTAAIRPASIFGEGDVQLLPGLLAVYGQGLWKVQLGNNDNDFDFTYVGNVAHAHILAAVALLETHARSVPPAADERVDGEVFFITNDNPVKFWDFGHAVWRTAGYQFDPKNVWVLQPRAILIIATMIEWVFWLLFGARKKPNFTPAKVRYATLTRTFCIDKAKKRLGYRPLVSIDEGIRRGVEWALKEKEAKATADEKKKD